MNAGDHRADEWLSARLDEGEAENSPPEPTDWTQGERDRLAELLLIHGLLERTAHPPTPSDTDLVARALQEIDAPGPGQPKFHRARLPRAMGIASLLSTALAVLVIVGAWLARPATTVASTLDQVLATARKPVERIYDLRVYRAEEAPRQARLYGRGDGPFAVVAPAPLGGRLWLGYDGDEAWLVPARGPVLVAERPSRLEDVLAEVGLPLPLFRLDRWVAELPRHYDLESRDDPFAPEDVPRIQIVGTLRGAVDGLPQRVELRANRRTNEIDHLVLSWDADSGGGLGLGVERVAFERRYRGTLPSDVFRHDSHHAPDRAVLRR